MVSVLFNEPKLLKFPFGVPARTALPRVSVLFNEPKLLKLSMRDWRVTIVPCFSALQRAEIAEIVETVNPPHVDREVSVLFNEPKLLKCGEDIAREVKRWRFQCSSTSRNC